MTPATRAMEAVSSDGNKAAWLFRCADGGGDAAGVGEHAGEGGVLGESAHSPQPLSAWLGVACRGVRGCWCVRTCCLAAWRDMFGKHQANYVHDDGDRCLCPGT